MGAAKEQSGPEIQDRDIELLEGLLHSRLMTLPHASALFFNGSREAAKKRIQKLKSAGLVGERARKPYQPSILLLTRSGYMLLKERALLEELPSLSWTNLEKRLRVSQLTLKHELEVMDVKAAVCSAANSDAKLSVVEFSTWPLLFQFYASPGGSEEVLVKPDGFLRIHETESDGTFEHAFYLELDRSTETLDTLARRALCYLDYYQRGGLAERFGHPRSEFQNFPFRVLMVFKTTERRNNIAEKLLTQNPPILTQVWLSTFKEVKEDPLGTIWIRPRDYRAGLGTTPYAVVRSSEATTYRRQSERDHLVETQVRKQSLLGSDGGN